MTRQFGATGPRRKRWSGHSLQTLDDLPAPLRRWLPEAAPPLSPAPVSPKWVCAPSDGHSAEEADHTITSSGTYPCTG